jgi:hypothetical protein
MGTAAVLKALTPRAVTVAAVSPEAVMGRAAAAPLIRAVAARVAVKAREREARGNSEAAKRRSI